MNASSVNSIKVMYITCTCVCSCPIVYVLINYSDITYDKDNNDIHVYAAMIIMLCFQLDYLYYIASEVGPFPIHQHVR